ncbi:MAG: SGNH/GDSL hydrolase family protein [Acidobacteriota bacterium]
MQAYLRVPLAFLIWFAAASASAQPVVYLAFGDSITHGLGDGSVSCGGSPGGYPPRLSNNLEDRALANEFRTFGVCGELTSQGVSRIDQVLANHPDGNIVVIMEGTNDLSSNNISVESMRFNLNSMIDKVRDAGMVPVLAPPIPRAPEAGDNARTGFLTSLLRTDAQEADVDFANVFDAFLNIPNVYNRFYSDPFHPNSSGYGLMANTFVVAATSAADRLVVDPPEPCVEGPETLCLAEGRFTVEVEWTDFEGMEGRGQAVPQTGDTGFFWFFDEKNLELVVKVLDGTASNGNFWVFYGALSDVEYTLTITDSETGRRRIYENPSGNLASVGDTGAFPGDDDGGSAGDGRSFDSGPAVATPAPNGRIFALPKAPRETDGTCTPDETTLCLSSRFQATVRWTDFDGNSDAGMSGTLTDETGYFWFFDENNVELVLKVLDGRMSNDHFWVFFGSLSNVEYVLTVTDTVTGETMEYTNPLGTFGSLADTTAFLVPE